ncbi:MAG: STAS domain-containing protein [Pseudonocardiaceae bacterium]
MTAQVTGPGSAADDSLTVTALTSCNEQVLVLRVTGEVDLLSLERLRHHLHNHMPGAHKGVVLDFTGVSFLAACGLGLLAELAEQARAHEVTLRLVAHRGAVLRALHVVGMDGLVPRAATVAEAVVQCFEVTLGPR